MNEQPDLSKLTPMQLATMALSQKSQAAAAPATPAPAPSPAGSAPAKYSPQELMAAGLSGYRFDSAGSLVNPRGAPLGAVR